MREPFSPASPGRVEDLMAGAAADDELQFVETGMKADLDALLIYNVMRTHTHLSPQLEAALRGHDLSPAQFNVLLALRSAGQNGLLMGQIGQKLVVTKSNVTGLVDRLEKQGLVKRCALQDRRATAVRLTTAGQRLVQHATPQHARRLGELAEGLTIQEKRSLIQLLTKLRRHLRQGTEKT